MTHDESKLLTVEEALDTIPFFEIQRLLKKYGYNFAIEKELT